MSIDLDQFLNFECPDPDAMEAIADETPGLSDLAKRDIRAGAKAWRSDLAQEAVERLNKTSEVIGKETTLVNDSASEECRTVLDAIQALATGGSTGDALKVLAQAKRTHQSWSARLDSINEARERWEEDAEADPVEHLRAMQERFQSGNPRHGRRSITAKMLRGES